MIAVGDTVAIVLEGILPSTGGSSKTKHPIPVSVLPSGHVVTGYPMVVGSDGAISLPYVKPIEIAGLSVRQAEQEIAKTFVDLDILRPKLSRPTLTLVPKSVQRPQLDKLPATPSEKVRSRSPVVLREPQAITTQTGTPSFEDSYGRLNAAKSAIETLESYKASFQELRKSLADNLRNEELRKDKSDERSSPVLRMLKDQIKSSESKIDKIKFELELQQQYLQDIVEDCERDAITQEQLLVPHVGKLEMSMSLHEKGVLSFTELQDVKADVTKQQAAFQNAQQKLSRYAKILERWNAIVGDRLEEPSEAEPADKTNQ